MMKLRFLLKVLLLVVIIRVDAQTRVDSLLDSYFEAVGRDQHKAMQLAFQALEAARAIHDRHNEAVALECIGVQHYYRGNYGDAKNYLHEAENLYRKEGSHRGLASVYNNLGLVEQDLGNYSRAIACFSFALINDESEADHRGKAITLNNLGTVYLYKGEYDRAYDYFKHSLRLGKQMSENEAIANALNNLGLFHLDKQCFDSALYYFRKARLMADADTDLYGASIARINLAMAYAGLYHFDSADLSFDQALPSIELLGDPDLEMEYLIHFSELALLKKDYNEALLKLLAAQKINNRLEQKKKSAEIFRRMGSVLARSRDVEHAFAYFHLAKNIAIAVGLMPELAAGYAELSLAHGMNLNYDSARFYMEKFAEMKSKMLVNAPDSTSIAPIKPVAKINHPGGFKLFLSIGIALGLFWVLLMLFMRLARKKKVEIGRAHV